MATTHESLTIVSTPHAPAAIGPYSQAIKVGDLLFCSGCIPLDPTTAQVVDGGIAAQTEQAMKNLKTVVEAGGSALGKVVKTTVFLKSMDDFATVNGIYAKVFGDHKPARSAVEVARLPKDVLVEVECIARCVGVDDANKTSRL
ncbi:Endoribonuclease L-PSP/chorismate mutase-like protein [Infundibulicybe gibba]|nr:Endoribonuclease L-PSP/chorismate mutase-like protein [Infundibulicybe gibba]